MLMNIAWNMSVCLLFKSIDIMYGHSIKTHKEITKRWNTEITDPIVLAVESLRQKMTKI